MSEKVRKVLSGLCALAGSLSLVLGVIAGYANQVLLDGPTFAGKVDSVRQVDQVSKALGRSLADRYIAGSPDLVAVRPLVETVAASVVSSAVLSGPTRAAAGSFQRAATEPNSGDLVLRVADVGAVLAAALQQAVPRESVGAPTVSVELARIGGQSWAAGTILAARYLRLAAWLMPLGGTFLLALSVYLSRRRRRAMLTVGVCVLASCALAALVLLAVQRLADAQDELTVRGSLVKYGWAEFAHPLWWWLAGVALLGAMVTASAAALLPQYDASAIVGWAWARVAERPSSFVLDLLRSLLFVVAGAATLVDPLAAATVAAVAAGLALILYGMAELARTTHDEQLPLTHDAAVAAREVGGRW